MGIQSNSFPAPMPLTSEQQIQTLSIHVPHAVPNCQVPPHVMLPKPHGRGTIYHLPAIENNLRLKEVWKSTQSCPAGPCGARTGTQTPRSRAYALHRRPAFHTHLKNPSCQKTRTPVLGMSQQIKAKRKGQACPLQGVVGKNHSNKKQKNV